MRYRPSRWLLVATLPLGLPGLGCDASGSTQGGAALVADHCAGPDLGHTWTDLYTCYFGPSGKTSCVGQGFCHGSSNGTGAFPVGWTCGTTRESCWQGMWQAQSEPGSAGMVCNVEAVPSDAGSEAGPADASASDAADAAPPQPPVVCVVASDPTTTKLWGVLRGTSSGIRNMPWAQVGEPGITLDAQDLDRISAWIREGALDN